MDKFLSKQQVKVILQEAPKGSDAGRIVQALADKGYKLEGFNDTPPAEVVPKATSYEVAMGSKNPDGTPKIDKGIIPQAVDTFKEGFKQTQEGAKNPDLIQGLQQIARGTLNEMGAGIRAAFSPIEAGLKVVSQLPGFSQAIDAIQKNVIEPTSDKISDIPAVQQFMQSNPHADEVVGNLIAIVGAIAGGKKAPEIKGAVSETASKVATVADDALSKTKQIIDTTTEAIKKNRMVKDAAQVDDLAGKIIQGKKTDIAKAQKALSSIDTTEIKTYSDLANALDEKITNVSTKLDENLAISTETRALKDLTLKTKVGNKTVAHNYVQDAITQLKDHYSAINDIPALEKINQLESKAKKGLTVKELNDLAKEHGQAINAFNANGEAASGLTKQAAENTRTGVKSTARDIFNDPLYKAADTELTGLIKTKDLVKNVETKVNQLQQRITQRGFGEKVGRLAFQIADKFTGGGLKGFVQSFVPRGEGLKIMNALDLENALAKNLKKLQKALDAKTELEMTKNLEDMLKP